MSNDRPKRESMSLKELAISNMWEIAALVELLEKKGLCTKQDLYDIIGELRHKNPKARLPETVFPSPYVMTQTEEQVINDLLAVINKHGVDATRSPELLEHLGQITGLTAPLVPTRPTLLAYQPFWVIEMGLHMTRETMHSGRSKHIYR